VHLLVLRNLSKEVEHLAPPIVGVSTDAFAADATAASTDGEVRIIR
jgi:hypothetical protein